MYNTLMAQKADSDEETAENTNTQSHKYFADQFDDEKVLFVFRRHPIVMRKGLVLGMLGPLLGIIPVAIKPDLGFGWFFGGLALGIVLGYLVFLPSWIGWHFSVFIVTDQRFIQITQKGMFHRAVSDLGLQQIQSINYEVSGLQETLLGYGTIKMQTYIGDLEIKEIHHPAKIQKRIIGILREEGVGTNPYPANNDDKGRTDLAHTDKEDAAKDDADADQADS